jgi:hypothetical protein
VALRRIREHAAEVTDLEDRERRQRLGFDRVCKSLSGFVGDRLEHKSAAASRRRILRVARHAHELRRLDRLECVGQHPAERSQPRHTIGLAAQVHRDDCDDLSSAQRFRRPLDVGHRDEPEHEAQRLRRVERQLAKQSKNIACALRRPQQHAAIQLGEPIRAQFEGGHDRRAPATSPQRPEQIRLVVGVHATVLAGCEHDIERVDAVGRESVRTAQPADPAG